jgi:hypothetical protein
MPIRIAILLIAAIPAYACRAAVVGTAIYAASTHNAQQKQQFMAQLQQTNTEREAKGLPPLTWCSQAYHFDIGWAESDPECAKLIALYEKGDKTALDSVVGKAPAPDTTKNP